MNKSAPSLAFIILIFITSFMMEAIGTYISVVGLGALFAGDIIILIMAGVLDIAKIVSVSFIFQYWEKIKVIMRYYMLVAVIIENPNSPVAVALSLVPFTSSLTMLIRQGVTILPAWQIALSSIILVVSAIAAIWLAGRAFRLGMLRYGKRLTWRELFQRKAGAA